ncbi:hypothetical protein WICPIJ_007742 [Wickerhamomyces pijperi]|uniref:Transcription factor IIIC 90kDa subunit N-terminal domain-containing protein n=1 Tax=Wickerhamomyces pijperi TaxID=599730 RepID=A0A9P8Q150_WICPI|nr:hypothetical protein WICPIJ_007742 [Wickerhamomyces pijperi]
MLQNLLITRTEVADITDGIKWSATGEIAINSKDRITFLKPNYLHDLPKEQQVKGTKDLFQLELANHDELQMNNYFFKSEMSDERGSSVFVNYESSVVKFEYSPLTLSQTTYLALLTNKGTLMILKDKKSFQKLNPDEVYTSQSHFNEWKFETFEWVSSVSEGVLSLTVGLKSGGIQVYQLNETEDSFELKQTLPNVSNSPIVAIKSYSNSLFIVNESNEILQHDIDSNTTRVLLTDNVFQIYDFIKTADLLIFSTPTKLHKFSFSINQVVQSIDVGYYQATKLYLTDLDEILVTFTNANITSCKLQIQSFETEDDNLIAPVVKRRISKWNKAHNDFKDKDPVCKIYGMAFNYDKSIVCFIYEIKNRLTLQYTIESESSLNIEFVTLPKNENFKLSDTRGSSFAVYQNYQITRDEQLLRNAIANKSIDVSAELNYSLPFDKFLNDCILKNKLFHEQSVNAVLAKDLQAVENTQRLLAKLILNYAETNKGSIESPFDQFVLNNYALINKQTPLFPEATSWSCTLLESFTESFQLQTAEAFNPEAYSSEEGHNWLRCAVTLLPLLTDKVLIDPIFDHIQILDIKTLSANDLDMYGEMGPFTKDILKILSKISLFSGGVFQLPTA